MAAKKKQTVLSTLIGIVVVLTFLWSRYQEASDGQGLGLSQLVEAEVLGDTLSASPSAPQGGPTLRQVQLLSTHYQIWDDCVMVDHRGNDGDSFHIQALHGREEVRIYYVDAPESAARSYRDGNTNHLRIAQQGAAMGGLDQAETTRVGLKAKALVKQLLDGKRFQVVTSGERVYSSHRKYAFVIVDWNGQLHYLHELLVMQGLGRIHTKPAYLPDNTTASEQKKHLKNLEAYAKNMRYGAWSLSAK